MQSAFLDTPGLTLTVRDAERRFDVDEITCQAVLGVLADAGVLARTPHGVYSRFVPRPNVSRRGSKTNAA
jgi:predicted transcriptional regulator of viral defense system